MAGTEAATNTLLVGAGNEAQLAAWDGDEGSYWARRADHFDRAVAAYHPLLLDAAAIEPSDRVLDIGCGTGQTTRDAARSARAGWALGVDLSAAMLDVARRRAEAEGVANIGFEQADAQVHPFDRSSFDVVVSRTAMMFFANVDAGFANAARALRPSGRLAVMVWQRAERNEWINEFLDALSVGRDLAPPPPTGPGPFSLGDAERIRRVLDGAGFVDVELDEVERPMWFGTDANDAHAFMLGLLGWTLRDLDDDAASKARNALMATMERHATSDGVLYGSAAWIIRARRG